MYVLEKCSVWPNMEAALNELLAMKCKPVLSGPLWCSLVHFGVLWCTEMCCKVLWCTEMCC